MHNASTADSLSGMMLKGSEGNALQQEKPEYQLEAWVQLRRIPHDII
jgi:hypothetical protein